MVTLQNSEIAQARAQIRKSLAQLEGHKVLVVGDIGIDEYLSGEVRRISPEAPVPVVEVRNREYRVGLAANVAQNVQSLGGQGVLIGLVGQDGAAKDLGALLKSTGVSEQNLVVDPQRPTTRKVRVMSGQHHIVRVDFEERKFLSPETEAQIIRMVDSTMSSVDGVVLQDYGKGVLSENLCQKLIASAHRLNKKVVVDPHRTTPVKFYAGADVIKPNRDEAYILSGLNFDDLRNNESTLREVGESILKQTGAQHLVITSGKDGAYIFETGSKTAHSVAMIRVPTAPRQVFDVTGAGDTFVAAFALGWFNGFSLIEATLMANAASGVVVGKIGSVPCKKSELEAALDDYHI